MAERILVQNGRQQFWVKTQDKIEFWENMANQSSNSKLKGKGINSVKILRREK